MNDEMMIKLKLNPQNFITSWLVSGPAETVFSIEAEDDDQLRYEKYMRSVVSDRSVVKPEGAIKYGEKSQLGVPWNYYYSPGNWFVDVAGFYSVPTKLDMYAAVVLKCDSDIQVEARLWTYAAIDMWINDQHICQVQEPVYKPITQKAVCFELVKGDNLLFVRMQNMGIRDTRHLFGVEIKEGFDRFRVEFPDRETIEPFIKLDIWLSSIILVGRKLVFDGKAPSEVKLRLSNEVITIKDEVEFLLSSDETSVEISGNVFGQHLSKRIDIIVNSLPKYEQVKSKEANRIAIYNRIADMDREDRHHGLYFSIFNVLARYSTNRVSKKDRQYIFDTLDLIERRIDCSDFLVVGLIRLVKEFDLDQKVLDRIEEVLLNYRYWMDEQGADGMCFWSENHALMFYGAALVVGELYSDKWFSRAQKMGDQVQLTARRRCVEWLSDIEDDGFEEFISAGYMCVTFGALLNLVDYGDNEISNRASKLTDKLLEELAIHTFNGSVIGPQGRVYRDVILPFTQGVQALMNLIDPSKPYALNEWMSIMATSRYQIPDKLSSIMDTPIACEYETGNALIRLKKTKDYMVTSVQSPREDKTSLNWENISLQNENQEEVYDQVDKVEEEFSKKAEVHIDSYHYIKSINERYHGTTNFQPGIYGYQQHMWYVALDNDCVIFTNHPGGTYDGSSMRPGYWYGNGLMPALKQVENIVGVIYSIPDDYPIHFTHVFWPTMKFSEVVKEGKWLFGRKNNTYVALWCSVEMEAYNDQLFECEYRVNYSNVAYLCYCSSREECQTFQVFIDRSKLFSPEFNEDKMILSAESDFRLNYIKVIDKTQYV